MNKIISTLNSQKNLSYTLPMDWGIGVIHFVSLFQMHLLVPVPSTRAAQSKIRNQVITPQRRTLFLVIVRCILAFGFKNNHDDVDSCQRDRRTKTHPTCALVPVLHRRHCQIPTSYCHHRCTCGSTESTCSILEWWRKLGCRSLEYHASLQRRCTSPSWPLPCFSSMEASFPRANARDKGYWFPGGLIVHSAVASATEWLDSLLELATHAIRTRICCRLPSLVVGVHLVHRGFGFVPGKKQNDRATQDGLDFILHSI